MNRKRIGLIAAMVALIAFLEWLGISAYLMSDPQPQLALHGEIRDGKLVQCYREFGERVCESE